MGMSMGGTLTALTIESKPELYAGALSLCGAIAPSDTMFQRDFALRAAFDYYFPDLLGPLVPVPDDYMPDARVEAKIIGAFASKPDALQALLRWYGAAEKKNIAPIIAFNTYEVKEMQRRARASPFDNADFVYVGSGDDAALNDGVHRYHGDAKAR
jgi:pimeloyl-ACP methyl ester carboxylesterase